MEGKTDTQQQPTQQTPAPTQGPRDKKFVWTIVILVIAIILLGALIWYQST